MGVSAGGLYLRNFCPKKIGTAEYLEYFFCSLTTCLHVAVAVDTHTRRYTHPPIHTPAHTHTRPYTHPPIHTRTQMYPAANNPQAYTPPTHTPPH
eukprot:NODE_8639_length_349_cov_21.963333_g6881_i0.p1 GENE.NODE_8639_length_349_cov_21.963333_g6881_i0~~NODE_8639_length_349_cov_21.963333_g6881_i0.p1  ORF type:complete len:95 (-),score=2.27 NODE_8639_length_349_cov_21.963333_g6881_i0:34-318(-)